jgi:cytochrome c biogenesis protein CcdA
MDIGLSSYGLSFLAGILSILAPCVLPLLPILLTSAAAEHRLGPFALALGLMLSFTTVGIVVIGFGASAGLDPTMFRYIGADLMILFGVLLLSSSLQARFAMATSGASGMGQNMLARVSLDGLSGQFILGLLLGIVWSPCVGPTLGAAIVLASQGQALLQVIIVMALFGLGAGLPLIALGLVSRQVLMRWRGNLLATGQTGKKILGAILLLAGVLILSGLDKTFEGWLLNIMPDWLNNLTTRF